MKTTPVAPLLQTLLADTYALFAKTHAAHWNVTGTQFFSLHDAFEDQYKDLLDAADEIAERLRALGQPAAGGLGTLAKLSTLKEPSAKAQSAADLVATLRDDHRAVAATVKKVLAAAQKAGDDVTADLCVERLHDHDKTVWMLGSFLSK